MLVEEGLGGLVHGREFCDAGVDEQNVELAEFFFHKGEEGVDVGELGNVGAHRSVPAPISDARIPEWRRRGR